MHKPRFKKFDVHGEAVKIDTRCGKNGYYPGDEVMIRFNNYTALIVGCDIDGNMLMFFKGAYELLPYYYIPELNKSTDIIKLIKRHASPKLIKQMKML